MFGDKNRAMCQKLKSGSPELLIVVLMLVVAMSEA